MYKTKVLRLGAEVEQCRVDVAEGDSAEDDDAEVAGCRGEGADCDGREAGDSKAPQRWRVQRLSA